MKSPSRPPGGRLGAVLDAAMADRAEPFAALSLADGSHAHDRGPGVVELVPARAAAGAAATVISAGVHGDETAPLELLLMLAGALDRGELAVGAPTLLIVGHPAAIVADRRYLDTNLNRLFTRQPLPTAPGAEHRRALRLMAAVDAFWAAHPVRGTGHDVRATALHLDLHTAIRASRYPRFAVVPDGGPATPAAIWPVMAGAGLQAVLFQHAPSPTFSHYSRAVHGVPAFTLELGRVAAFGNNDLAPLAPMRDWLAARIAGAGAAAAPAEGLAYFGVVEELRRVGEAFALGFGADIANFAELAPGTLIASDSEAGERRVGTAPVHVVFPNAAVERGARAALLARPVASPSS